jgi:glycosyltransferase involved in cell wall biosynthesis
MTIWVEGKNPALYSSGISHWLHDLLHDFDPNLLSDIQLILPKISEGRIYPDLKLRPVDLWWPKALPRKIGHLLFDNILFGRAARKAKPGAIFSPYFDVLMPKGIPSVITIHDLCYVEAAESYPFLQRTYFNIQMKRNLHRAKMVVTVSQSSKNLLVSLAGVSAERIIVVENTLSSEFSEHQPTPTEISELRRRIGPASHYVLYTGGFENRKNIPNLLQALKELNNGSHKMILVVTGNQEKQWAELIGSDSSLLASIYFTGYLSNSDLKTAYMACDAVVAPSLSEGFGRSCLEAITTGTPLACSDIPVFREVAGAHGIYFDPKKTEEISSGIQRAINQGRYQAVDVDADKRQRQIKVLENILIDLSKQ